MIGRITTILLALLIAGCSRYDVSINDKVVYGPAQLFTGYNIPDIALAECVKQAVIDAQATRASAVKQLNCSSAGVENLEGLHVFSGLVALKLSDNNIRNLVELERLTALQKLWLDGNQVVDPVPLRALETLQIIDLYDNNKLQCPAAPLFSTVATVVVPEHCKTS